MKEYTKSLILSSFLIMSVLSITTKLRQNNISSDRSVTPPNEPILPPPSNNVTQPKANIPEETKIPEVGGTEANIPESYSNVTANKSTSNITETQPQEATGLIPPSSSVVVNTKEPIITISGQASGAIQSDLIKIGILILSKNISAEQAQEDNRQKYENLISDLKNLGIGENNTIYLGNLLEINFKNESKNESILFPTDAIEENYVNNATSQGQNLLPSNATESNIDQDNQKDSNLKEATFISQLEIRLNDTVLANKILELLNKKNYKIKYVEFANTEETSKNAINDLIDMAISNTTENAKSSIDNSGYDLDQLVSLNVDVDKSLKNIIQGDQLEKSDFNITQNPRMKTIRVGVTMTFSLKKSEKPIETSRNITTQNRTGDNI